MTAKNNLTLGFSFVLFHFSCVFLSVLSFWLNFGLREWIFFVSLGLCQLYILTSDSGKKERILHSLLFYTLLGSAILLSQYFLDLSWDGNYYHKAGIIEMANGWNPIWGPIISDSDPAAVWVNYYPKVSWIIGGLFYKVFGFIECGKTPNFICLFATFFLTTSLVQTAAPSRKWLCWTIGLLSVMNPVSLMQLFTNYLDIQLGSFFIWSIIFFYLFLETKETLPLVGLIFSTALLAGVKSSGIVYGSMTLFFFFVFLALKKRELLKRFCVAIFVWSILTLAVGYNPYVTNVVRYGHIFYPLGHYSLSGQTTKENVLYGQIPERIREYDRYQKFLYSLFSESDNGEHPKLKIPFTVHRGEAGNFYSWEIRTGGFGPLFSGALILSLILMFSLRGRREIWFVPLLLFLTTIVNPEPHNARYIPQFYFIPVYALFLYLVWSESDKRKRSLVVQKAMGLALGLTLFFNAWAVAENNWRKEAGTSESIKKILAEYKGKTIDVDFRNFTPLRTRLSENGVSYRQLFNTPKDQLAKGIAIDYQMVIFPNGIGN